MIEERGIGGPYLERAAAEQMANQLADQGWEISREASFGDLRVDLVARRGGETVFYEFKVAGSPARDGWPQQLGALQVLAREHDARFRLVLVRPPRETELEIAGIERMLLEALVENPPWQVADIAGHTLVDEVEGVDLISIRISGTAADVRGDGLLGVTLQTGGGEFVSSESFPFSFSATLDLAARRADRVEVEEVDTSSWYGDEMDSGPAEHGDGPEDDHPEF